MVVTRRPLQNAGAPADRGCSGSPRPGGGAGCFLAGQSVIFAARARPAGVALWGPRSALLPGIGVSARAPCQPPDSAWGRLAFIDCRC